MAHPFNPLFLSPPIVSLSIFRLALVLPDSLMLATTCIADIERNKEENRIKLSRLLFSPSFISYVCGRYTKIRTSSGVEKNRAAHFFHVLNRVV